MNKHLQLLTQLTGILTQANLGVPIIFGAVSAVSAIVKGLTGTGPTLAQIADLIDAQLDQNDEAIRSEIARLKANIGVL